MSPVARDNREPVRTNRETRRTEADARTVLVALPQDHPFRAVADGSYRPPQAIDDAQWERALPLVLRILADNGTAFPATRGRGAENRSVLAAYGYWLAGEREPDQLTPDVALDEGDLQRFIRAWPGRHTWRSRTARLSKLRRFRCAYPAWFPPRTIAPADPELTPTTDREFTIAWAATDTFRNPTTRDHVRALLLLARGAGLDGVDIQYVAGTDIRRRRDAGLWVTVRRPGHERDVPVLARYAARLEALATEAGVHSVVGRGIPPTAVGQPIEVTGMLERRMRHGHPGMRVTPSRLRKAWLAEQLGRGTPVRTLLRAAGLVSFRAVESLVAYCPAPPQTARGVAEQLGGLGRHGAGHAPGSSGRR